MTTRILVVDDVPEIVDAVSRAIRRLKLPDVELVATSDPSRARHLVVTEPFQLVISDFRMPGIDGISLLRLAYAQNPHGLRVLVTGYNEIPTDMESIRAARVDAYLQKPVALQDLLLFLRDCLSPDPRAMEEHRRQARAVEASHG